MAKDWKERLGVVYSTNAEFNYENEKAQDTLAPHEQKLRVLIDRKRRKGKTVTLVQGFVGADESLKELGKLLKSKCGSGGSEKEGEIIIQGDFAVKIKEILSREGYKVK
jgi:translation initiation factor 1